MKVLVVALVGLACSGAVAGIWMLVADGRSALAALAAGLLATGAQVLAHLWMSGVPDDAPASVMWRRHLHGTALRMGAAGIAVVLVIKDGESFPPLATVLSFVGVLFGVLAVEIRNRA